MIAEGQFVYESTSEPISYSNWADGEPNDNGGTEDCVFIYANTNGKWNDGDFYSEFFSVCEKEPICNDGYDHDHDQTMQYL